LSITLKYGKKTRAVEALGRSGRARHRATLIRTWCSWCVRGSGGGFCENTFSR